MSIYPFAAIVGQEQLKLALILNAINPRIGGVLIRGEKGTAKSTAVRALASLLPEMDVLEGSPLGCGPDEQENACVDCRLCAPPRNSIRRRVPVVTLPLNATEDCLVGGIDFDRTIHTGRRVLQPGLLARAHRGIVYVDEVNLLDDHLVDIILDAAASGKNHIEREGISFTHQSRFVLIGTMNPEEGELRPQFLDRFGLCVEVKASSRRDDRVLTLVRREAYDADPAAFCQQFEAENKSISRRIVQAREMLAGIGMSERLRLLIAEICMDNYVVGHRADLVVEQAAKALAAYRGLREVTAEEIHEVALFALLHRKRENVPAPPPRHDNKDSHQEDGDTGDGEKGKERQERERAAQGKQDSRPESGRTDANGDAAETDKRDIERKQREGVLENIFEVGETFKVKRFSAPKDRVSRRGSGRRTRTRIAQKQGCYIKSVVGRGSDDIALDATLRAAAPYQSRRKNDNGLAIVLRPEDIREKVREKRIGNFILFVIDASGSMGARGRMTASKGAVMSLLLDAYQKRDKVALISFRKNGAEVNLPPTSSVELAARLLEEMPVGGRTPLSAGLLKSDELLRSYLLRDPTSRPIVIIVTDGKSNVAVNGKKPMDEVFSVAEQMARDDRTQFIVVDTEQNGVMAFGLAQKIADVLDAKYFKITDMKAESLIDIVKGET